jgi:hypothetical protein
MHTRFLHSDEITPPPMEQYPDVSQAIRVECVLAADWHYVEGFLGRIYAASCSARILIHLPEYYGDPTMHPDSRAWLLEKVLLQHSRASVWHRALLLLALERAEIRFISHHGLEFFQQPFGTISHADGTSTLFTLMPTPSAVHRFLWVDHQPDRVQWGQREFEALWQHPHVLPCSPDRIERMLHPRAPYRAPIVAAWAAWLVPDDINLVCHLATHTTTPLRYVHRCRFAEHRLVRATYYAVVRAQAGKRVAIIGDEDWLLHVRALLQHWQCAAELSERIALLSPATVAAARAPFAEVWCATAEAFTPEFVHHSTVQAALYRGVDVVLFGLKADLADMAELAAVLVRLATGCEHVFGNSVSRWRRPTCINELQQSSMLAESADLSEIWEWVRNPLPPSDAHPICHDIRTNLRIGDSQNIAHRMALTTQLSPRLQERLYQFFPEFLKHMTPWSRFIVDDNEMQHAAFLQEVTIEATAWDMAQSHIIQRISAILRMQKHCLFWVDQAVDTVPLRTVCQALPHVAVIYIGEQDCTVNGQMSLLHLLPNIIQTHTCLVLGTPAAAHRILAILPYLDITLRFATAAPALATHIKRWAIGRHEAWYWDVQHGLSQRAVLPAVRTVAPSVYIPRLSEDGEYAWESTLS